MSRWRATSCVETLEMWRSQGIVVEGNRVYLDGAQLRAVIRARALACWGYLG
ncbi:hypothetical protein [uncultured Ruegeria sp.]|uniref:hypothetical protein n=1 Tax=uncultured Ruegeria sp. TaxID=259304 RepID=UPI002621AC6F|nr:hypothetical protein [uncultured Ruegeria sp.]